MSYLTKNGYNKLISDIPIEQYKRIKKELTVSPQNFNLTEKEIEDSKYKLYGLIKNKNIITLPKFYGIDVFGPPVFVKVSPDPIDIKFIGDLREKQTYVVNKTIVHMNKYGGGLISVPCGFGKTICGLKIIAELKTKTLVVVHKTFLQIQWKEKIKEFLPSASVGLIRQKICSDGDIVIGIIHTISKKNYGSLFSKFGLVIFDEAHHIPSKFFSKTLLKTCTKYTLALTATPYRNDGLIKVMYWFTGGTIYQEKIKINRCVIVKRINFTSTDRLFKTKKRWMKGMMRYDTLKMSSNICEIETRNYMIANIICHFIKNDKLRKILILSNYKKHLSVIKNQVDQYIEQQIKEGALIQSDIYCGYYTGDVRPAERAICEERGDIIFATYGMANEGLDIKHLNTVIIASPKKDVVQSVGRIMRTILSSGDIKPLIIDLVDTLDVIENWGDEREKKYRECEYEIHTHESMDGINPETIIDIFPQYILHENDFDTVVLDNDVVDIKKDIQLSNQYFEEI